MDIEIVEEHKPKEDVDLLKRYHDHEHLGGVGKYWIYIKTKRDKDMNWIIDEIKSYGLAEDADLKRAVIRVTSKHVFVLRSNNLYYMLGLCAYLKRIVVNRPMYVLRHYIY